MTVPVAYTETASASELRERLILEHLPQVRWIAARIHEKLPPEISLEDLVSTGIVGLIQAIDAFDPSRNAQLKTYAEYRIRGAILDSIRGLDGVPINRRKQIKQVEAAIQALEHRNGTTPGEEEIAAELRISIGEYHEWLYELRGVSIGSLSSPLDESSSLTLADCIPSPSGEIPSQQLEKAELERLLADGIRWLPRTEQILLSLYYRDERNMREIAPILGISLARVCQLKTQAIMRLRSFLMKKWPAGKGGNL